MIFASAPGKLMLFGEYAVLNGATAVVSAVDRRAEIRMAPLTGEEWQVEARPLAMEITVFRFRADGQPVLLSGPPLPTLVHVLLRDAVLRCPALGRQGWRLTLDTCALHDMHGTVPVKFGLGSSAAIAASLAAALGAAGGRPMLELGELVELHSLGQGGRGSGADVAAAMFGGQIMYRTGSSGPRAAPVMLPRDLSLAVIFAGRPASTADALETLERWAARQPATFEDCMHHLGSLASLGERRLRAGGDLGEIIAHYADGLRHLQQSSGLPIFSAGHERAAELAADAGCVYKPSGAGGGDLGILVATDPAALSSALGRLHEDGLHQLDIRLGGRGALANAITAEA